MDNHDVIHDVVGILGNVISLCLLLSPVPTFIEITKKRAVEKYSPAPYLAFLMNCMLWCLYGLPIVHPNSLLVITINGTGVVLESIYLIIFVIFSDSKQRVFILLSILAELVVLGSVTAFALTTFDTHEKRSLVVGIFCVIFGICMYASPLSVMTTQSTEEQHLDVLEANTNRILNVELVIKTRSVKYMPFTLSFVSFLNGICWTTYALIRFDIFITIPNALGTLLSIAQLIIYGLYYRTAANEHKGPDVIEAKSEAEDLEAN